MSEIPAGLEGIVSELHHVAIVVRSIDEARPAWEAIGLACGEPEFIEDQDVNVLVCTVGGQRIELVAQPRLGRTERRRGDREVGVAHETRSAEGAADVVLEVLDLVEVRGQVNVPVSEARAAGQRDRVAKPFAGLVLVLSGDGGLACSKTSKPLARVGV